MTTETTTAATTTATTTAATTTAATTTAAATGAFDFSAHGVAGDDLGYVQNKGFKGPGDIVTAYRNLESFVGDRDSLIRIPKERTPENMRKDVWSKLGAGENVEAYEKIIPVPEGDKSGFNKVAAGWFNAHGIPLETAKALVTEFNKYGADLVKTTNEATQAEHKTQLQAYQREKGAAWEDTLKTVDNVAETFGMSQAHLEAFKGALGPVEAIKLFERMGAKLGTEGKQINGDGNENNMRLTPDQAKQKIRELQQDPLWSKRFLEGDHIARQESDRLHQMAYPES